jgi:uncharacterized protein (TIGR02145 family)
MKKLSLLLLCALSALAGAAQTDVSVSNFQAMQGASATATFSVSWTPASKTGSDSVWVFVDYNTAGTMKRLPLATATASVGTVHAPNEWGVWVVAPVTGGARFATTVTLSSATTYSYGSCAYAIPQLPVAQYTGYNAIKFTGTPPFELTFTGSGGSVSVPATTYTLPAGKTPASVTDATRAPGVITCTTPSFVRQPGNTTICPETAAMLDAMTRQAAIYQWYKNGDPVSSESSGTVTSYTAAAAAATYWVVATIDACSATSDSAAVSVNSAGCGDGCTKPEATVNFTAFAPCTDAVVGSTWYLTDTRESANKQTYRVRKMPDGKIWMVEDLKFGDRCDAVYTPSTLADQQGLVSSSYTQHYGDCVKNSLYGGGYYYDIAAGLNLPGLSSCSSTHMLANRSTYTPIQGACPDKWAVPHYFDWKTLQEKLSQYEGRAANQTWCNSPMWNTIGCPRNASFNTYYSYVSAYESAEGTNNDGTPRLVFVGLGQTGDGVQYQHYSYCSDKNTMRCLLDYR